MRRKNFIILLILTFILALILGIFIGRVSLKREGNEDKVSFYAHVLENRGLYLLVEGIEENDINHRYEFQISLKDSKSTVLDIDGNKIELSEIPIGKLIRITYEVEVLEVYPAVINSALLIERME